MGLTRWVQRRFSLLDQFRIATRDGDTAWVKDLFSKGWRIPRAEREHVFTVALLVGKTPESIRAEIMDLVLSAHPGEYASFDPQGRGLTACATGELPGLAKVLIDHGANPAAPAHPSRLDLEFWQAEKGLCPMEAALMYGHHDVMEVFWQTTGDPASLVTEGVLTLCFRHADLPLLWERRFAETMPDVLLVSHLLLMGNIFGKSGSTSPHPEHGRGFFEVLFEKSNDKAQLLPGLVNSPAMSALFQTWLAQCEHQQMEEKIGPAAAGPRKMGKRL
jgi:hypothetical protein